MVIKNKKLFNQRQRQALRFIRNSVVHEGRSPSVRELAEVLGYKSPRTAFLVLQSLIDEGWLRRKDNGDLLIKRDPPASRDRADTVEIPVVGNVACGAPLLAEQNVEAYVHVSTVLARPGRKYFLLRAIGDSMNQAGINMRDLVLVRQQQSADNGQRIVALVDDEATIKEFHREKDVVVLRPRSTNRTHKPIVLTEDFIIQGVVVAVLPSTI